MSEPVRHEVSQIDRYVLPATIGRLLNRLQSRKRTLRTLKTAAVTATLTLLTLTFALLLDRLFDLPDRVRLLLTTSVYVMASAGAVAVVVALFSRATAEELARELDKASPHSRDLLQSSVNFTTRTASGAAVPEPFLLDTALRDAELLCKDVSPAQASKAGMLPVAIAVAGLTVLLLAGMLRTPWTDASLLLQRFLHPLANLPRPSQVKIRVDNPATATLQQDDDLAIAVSIMGPLAADERVTARLTRPNGKEDLVLLNPRPGGRYEVALKSIGESFTFTVSAGDGRSESHDVLVTSRPTIRNLIAQYTFPRYSRLPTKTESPARREFRAIEGTRVKVDFESSLPIEKSALLLGERSLPIHWDADNRRGTFTFTIERDNTLAIKIEALGGANNHREPPFRIRVALDNPPTAALLGMPDERSFFRDAVLNLGYKGTDDFGVSEVFVRYRLSGSPQNSRDFAIEGVVGGGREAAGDFQLPLRELCGEEDIWIELQLVVVDSKGQEGISPVERLSVTSDTPDRQLLELISFQERYQSAVARSLRAVDDIASNLGILLEGLGENDALTGSRKGIYSDVSRGLADLQFPLATDDPAYVFLNVSEYPYLLQRRTHDLLARAASLPDRSTYLDLIGAIEKTGTPRNAIQRLKARVDQALPATTAFAAALKALLVETRLTLISYQTSQYLGSAAKPSRDASLNQEKQEARLQIIGQQLTALQSVRLDAALASAMAQVQTDAKLPAAERASKLDASLGTLRSEVDGALDGRIGAAVEKYVTESSWPALFASAQQMQTLPRAIAAAGAWGRLSRNNLYQGTVESLLASAVQQSAMTGDAAAISRATEAAALLQVPGRIAELHDRAAALRRLLVDTDVEVRTGRLIRRSSAYEAQWRQARELLLSILNDHAAGRFVGLPAPAEVALTSLKAAKPVFLAWSGSEATDSPAWPQTAVQTQAALSNLLDALRPTVRDVRSRTAALIPQLLRDLDTNINREPSWIEAEMVPLKADCDLGYKNPGPPNNITTSTGKVLGRKADAPRVAFTKSLSERFASYALAVGAANDLRQTVWADEPAEKTMDELRAMAILFEYFSYLEEDVYDKTYAMHLQQILRVRTYPAYLEETGRYMTNLKAPIQTLSSALRRLASGDAKGLMSDPAFAAQPGLIGRQARAESQFQSLATHRSFFAMFDAKPDASAKAAALIQLLHESGTPTAYWDRVFLSCDRLQKDAADLGPNASNNDKWSGVPAERIAPLLRQAEQIRAMLPPAGDAMAGDEAKTIQLAMSEGLSLLPRVQQGKAGRDAADAFDDWVGKLRAAVSALDNRVTINAPKLRPRPRVAQARADLEKFIGRLQRNEEAWALRSTAAIRATASARAELLAPPALALEPTRDDLAFVFSREGIIRRRAAAAAAQASRGLNIESGELDEQFLKMPRYLYEELKKTGRKPYPMNFKDASLDYTQNLLKDSR